MKKFTLLFGICLCGQLLLSQNTFSRVCIDLKGKNVAELAALGIETDHGGYLPGRSLTVPLSETELQGVRAAGFETKVLIPDLKKWYQERRDQPSVAARGNGCAGVAGYDINRWPIPKHYTGGSMGGYPTYAEMLAILDDMRALYPGLITARAAVSDTILTHEGRPLFWVKISDNADTDEPETEALYTALHHSREPNSLSQLLFFMWYLLENYDQNPEIQYIVNNLELYFIPCINPDGYLYNEATSPQGGGLWRKNRRDNGNGTFGVDLNRNYGYQWGINDQGSSPDPNTQTYRGPAAFSEPETRMVRDFCLQHQFQGSLNYHTVGNLLIYPWAYSDELADPVFAELARLYIRENNFTYGTSIETVGYRVNGSSDDWMFGAADMYSFTPEVGPQGTDFWPLPSQIDSLNRSTIWQNLASAYSLLRFGTVTPKGGADFDLSKPKIEFTVKRFGFEDGPLTVSVQPLSANIVGVGPSVTVQLDQFEAADSAIVLAVASDVQVGDVIRFVLRLDNGVVTFRDTLEKTLLGPSLPVFSEPATLPIQENWTVAGNWDLTFDAYVSEPTSITDSPFGPYFPGEYSLLELSTPVFIPANAKTAELRFFARWAIERDFDFLQVYASGDNEVKSLCGRYTHPGNIFQIEGEPVFDGVQADWVEERMDLSDYIGKAVQIQFLLVSDDFQELDGFYFDDLSIEYTSQDYVGTLPIGNDQFTLRQNQPNPAGSSTTIAWNNPDQLGGLAELQVFNALGERVLLKTIDLERQSEAVLDTKTWQPGAYFYRLQAANWQLPTMKMTVQAGSK
ncbi:MAG: immune inhibitor A [Saprospiraceae bacterium]|nr:immune inhibitor A [Saprospiraceae bacterium]